MHSQTLVVRTVLLAIDVIADAPAGARISSRIGGKMIIRLLDAALGLVGVRLFLTLMV